MAVLILRQIKKNSMRKINVILVSLLIGLLSFQVVAQAQGTILPKPGKSIEGEAPVDCEEEINKFNNSGNFENSIMTREEVLGCAVTSGRISLPMVPYFIQYFSNFLLGLVSLIALLFVVIGGFLYIMGGLTQEKEKGKKFITNALFGMVLAFLAWSIVSVIISALTG